MHNDFWVDVSATNYVVLTSLKLHLPLRLQRVIAMVVGIVTRFEGLQLWSIIESPQRRVYNRILLRGKMHNILRNSFGKKLVVDHFNW